MLHNINELYGNTLAARDGDIGRVKDFYFDDKIWVVRYLVADTGSWLTGRLVLLSPHAFAKWDQQKRTLHISLQKKQIENSPSIKQHKPVSRQFEIEYYGYYGWPGYWSGGAMWGMGGFPMVLPRSVDESETHWQPHERDDPHLRSTQAVTGYSIQTVDGTIGHVSGFLIDDRSWAIRELLVETGHWFTGKEVMISTAKVEQISHPDAKVFVSLTKEDIQRTAEHAHATTSA